MIAWDLVLGGARLLMEIGNHASPRLRSLVLTPFMTCVFMAAGYTGICIFDAGSITEGVQQAWMSTAPVRLRHQAELEALALQERLQATARTDKLIEELMRQVLLKHPKAARARLAVIHDGTSGVTGINMLRFDIILGVVNPGNQVGTMAGNQPLADWSQYLGEFLAGNCSFADVGSMTSAAEVARMLALGVAARLACPVRDAGGRLLGGLFVTWSAGNVPDEQEVAALTAELRQTTARVSAALQLREP